jgi:hypothetical protein
MDGDGRILTKSDLMLIVCCQLQGADLSIYRNSFDVLAQEMRDNLLEFIIEYFNFDYGDNFPDLGDFNYFSLIKHLEKE